MPCMPKCSARLLCIVFSSCILTLWSLCVWKNIWQYCRSQSCLEFILQCLFWSFLLCCHCFRTVAMYICIHIHAHAHARMHAHTFYSRCCLCLSAILTWFLLQLVWLSVINTTFFLFSIHISVSSITHLWCFFYLLTLITVLEHWFCNLQAGSHTGMVLHMYTYFKFVL